MVNFNNKQKRIISIILASWSFFLIISGIIMNHQVKPIINTTYTLKIETKKIAEQQAKTNEIKLKDIEIEINNPISVDIRDYLENSDKISDTTLKALKLDTSLVNINQAGTYQYKIAYKNVASINYSEEDIKKHIFQKAYYQYTYDSFPQLSYDDI